MARFYCNVRIGDELIVEPEGDELPDAEAARWLALETIREMRRLPHFYGESALWEAREFVVTDDQGDAVAFVPFKSEI